MVLENDDENTVEGTCMQDGNFKENEKKKIVTNKTTLVKLGKCNTYIAHRRQETEETAEDRLIGIVKHELKA